MSSRPLALPMRRVGLRGMVRCGAAWAVVYKWNLLVVDVRRGRLLWSWIDSMRSAAIAAAVDGLKHHSDIEALVWDGARGHRGEMVRSVGLATIIQPPYSPELNPAERVFLRRWVEGWPGRLLAYLGVRSGSGAALGWIVNASSSTLYGLSNMKWYKAVRSR